MKKTTKQIFVFVLLVAILSLFGLKVVYGTSGEKIAVPSQSSFVLDGIPVTPGGIFNIEGGNYAQMRAVAELLSGTPSRFNIYWDAELGQTVIETGKAYTGMAPEKEEPAIGEEKDLYMIGESVPVTGGGVVVNTAEIYGVEVSTPSGVYTSAKNFVYYHVRLSIANNNSAFPSQYVNKIHFVTGRSVGGLKQLGKATPLLKDTVNTADLYIEIPENDQVEKLEIVDPQTNKIHIVFVN